jgi:hypothetical protein
MISHHDYLHIDVGDSVEMHRTPGLWPCVGVVNFPGYGRIPLIAVHRSNGGFSADQFALPIRDQVHVIFEATGTAYGSIVPSPKVVVNLYKAKAAPGWRKGIIAYESEKPEKRAEVSDQGRWLSGVDKYKDAPRDPKSPFRWL